MNPIFDHGPSQQLRLTIAVAASLLLIIFDHYFKSFDQTRLVLNSLVSPLQYAAEMPRQGVEWLVDRSRRKSILRKENAALRENQLLMNEQLQRYSFLESENARLRQLLASDVRKDASKMVAEVMSVATTNFSQQLVINKGSLNGVYEGQPVLSDTGIVGQIVNVGTLNSRVLLISDHTHAIPVRNARNDIALIAVGTGDLTQLLLQHVPHSTDVRVGDLLYSSGLGGVFPEGYPVAKVSEVISDPSRPFATIRVKPLASLDRLRYLLLLWLPASDIKPVHQAVEAAEVAEEEG